MVVAVMKVLTMKAVDKEVVVVIIKVVVTVMKLAATMLTVLVRKRQ